MNKIANLALSISLSLMVSGCATQRFDFNEIYVSDSPSINYRQGFWFFGIGQTQKIDVSDLCASRQVSRVDFQQTFGDIGLSIITFFIYTPRHVRVTCDK